MTKRLQLIYQEVFQGLICERTGKPSIDILGEVGLVINDFAINLTGETFCF
jgi:hypothetical protein